MIKLEGTLVKVSVRELVEFIMRAGDLDNRRGTSPSKDSMQAGSRIHRKIQRRMGPDYHAEVSMKTEVDRETYSICIEGRADGVIEEKDKITIDEIKGTYRRVDLLQEPIFVHQAQAMCYGYMYCEKHSCEKINIQMTYCHLETEEIKRFTNEYSKEFLDRWFGDLVDQYAKWAEFKIAHQEQRNQSIKQLEFPYEYRKGQREVTVSVYKAINRKRNLFIQAPTGVGKTLSTLFPAVKAVGEELGDKIFYLTAKTITRTVAYESMQILMKQDLIMNTIMLTAKEKICPFKEMECNPDACPRAKGHFDRINEAVFEMIHEERAITRDIISDWAQRYQVCPYELSLDLSYWMDVIICDYNYVFDPTVSLRRFFGENVPGDYLFLVDEAHNLVERGREMYSAVLCQETFLEIIDLTKEYSSKLTRYLRRCYNSMDDLRQECETYEVISNIGTLDVEMLRLNTELDEFLEEFRDFEHRKEILGFYFSVCNFLSVLELYDECYQTYIEVDRDGLFYLKLFCIDPSTNLAQYLDKGNSTIFFSATMLPIQYYKELLSGNLDDYAIYVDSPFEKENRVITLANDVSSKYTRRNEHEYYRIVQYLDAVLDGRHGNYMIFFPSYQMMKNVLEMALERGLDLKTRIIVQNSKMSETDREEFLKEFEAEDKKSLVAFCVMGGIFSEGIDLANDLLIGVIVVGTGLPQVCTEREILKQYFDRQFKNGFSYAYLNPGINKVLQSAGRVIRSGEDKGIIMLLDERFLQQQYHRLFPKEWDDIEVVNQNTVRGVISDFWNRSLK